MGLWKYIRGSWDNFTQFIRYDIGGSTKVGFGMSPLKDKYSNLCLIARYSKGTVTDYAEIRFGQISWTLAFICAVQD